MLQRFIDTFSKEAKGAGITRLEFYIKECWGQTVQVYKQEVERLNISQETLVYVEGEFEGCKGSTFLENLSTDASRISEHLGIIRQTAKYNKEPFLSRTYSAARPPVEDTAPEFPSAELVAERLREAEQKAYDSDRRIDNVGSASHTTRREKVLLLNGEGDALEDCVQYEQAVMSLVARDGTAVQSTYETRLGKAVGQKHLLSLAEQGAAKVVSQLMASPVKTGPYQVLLNNRLVCDLILAFLPGLFADRVQKKMSVLEGRVGETITSSLFSLVEDPNLSEGIVTRNFDDEGTPTQAKSIIDQGRLTTFLHNLETARTFQVQPTGNGFKSLYREAPAISATNLCVPAGEHTDAELIQAMGSGLLITDCDGIFAGANPVSGDFSLIAKGYLIENGAVHRPVNQITIAGNFYEMLNGLSAVGSEYAAGGSLNGFIQTPSLLISELFVSGT